MSAQSQLLFVIILNCIYSPYLFGAANVLVLNFENCDPIENYKFKFNATFKTVGDAQYVDATAVLTTPLDNDVRSNVSVEMLVGDKYVHLLSINERKTCEALNKYFGEFWYDIERHAQIIPRLCPLPVGKFHLHNYLLNFDIMSTLKHFPFGNLRFTTMVYDSKNNIFTCIRSEGEYRL